MGFWQFSLVNLSVWAGFAVLVRMYLLEIDSVLFMMYGNASKYYANLVSKTA